VRSAGIGGAGEHRGPSGMVERSGWAASGPPVVAGACGGRPVGGAAAGVAGRHQDRSATGLPKGRRAAGHHGQASNGHCCGKVVHLTAHHADQTAGEPLHRVLSRHATAPCRAAASPLVSGKQQRSGPAGQRRSPGVEYLREQGDAVSSNRVGLSLGGGPLGFGQGGRLRVGG